MEVRLLYLKLAFSIRASWQRRIYHDAMPLTEVLCHTDVDVQGLMSIMLNDAL